MQLVAGARVEGGKLHIKNRREFDRKLSEWQNCQAFVTVERAHATRSKAQNDYFHAVIVARVAAKLRQDVKFTKELLKAQFLPHEKAQAGTNGVLMNGLVIGGSTSKLDKLEFVEFLEKIVMWAAEKWDLYLPDPDAEWRQHAEQERIDASV